MPKTYLELYAANSAPINMFEKRHTQPRPTSGIQVGIIWICRYGSLSVIASTAKNRDLLEEFIGIIAPASKAKIAERGLFHYITTTGPPVTQRVRRLNPEKLQMTKAE